MAKPKNVILIVDDTPENLRVLGELLEADGHEVRVATNGAHGPRNRPGTREWT